jgi:myo-inositol-1(or 4)-monophosphatase
MVIDAVQKNFPGHSVLAEEGSNLIKDSEYTWVCDPVDGTVPFSHGIPTFAFSLALVKNGVSILGVIYDVMSDRMFYAEKGKGSYMNGEKIQVNKLKLEKGAVFCWPTSSASYLRKYYSETTIMSLYTICYEGVLIAAGELIASFYNYNNAHDIAALKVLIEEAGGKVTDKDGNEQRYDQKINGALISNGVVHEELIERIKELGI